MATEKSLIDQNKELAHQSLISPETGKPPVEVGQEKAPESEGGTPSIIETEAGDEQLEEEVLTEPVQVVDPNPDSSAGEKSGDEANTNESLVANLNGLLSGDKRADYSDMTNTVNSAGSQK